MPVLLSILTSLAWPFAINPTGVRPKSDPGLTPGLTLHCPAAIGTGSATAVL